MDEPLPGPKAYPHYPRGSRGKSRPTTDDSGNPSGDDFGASQSEPIRSTRRRETCSRFAKQRLSLSSSASSRSSHSRPTGRQRAPQRRATTPQLNWTRLSPMPAAGTPVPLIYPSIVNVRLVRAQSAWDRAAEWVYQGKPASAVIHLNAARSNMSQAWLAAKYVIETAPPPVADASGDAPGRPRLRVSRGDGLRGAHAAAHGRDDRDGPAQHGRRDVAPESPHDDQRGDHRAQPGDPEHSPTRRCSATLLRRSIEPRWERS